MKIVIALCSLATFAIAVPVYEENVFESSLSNQASSTKRVRKSALPDTPGLFPEHGIEKIPIQSNKKSSQGTSVEAKSFRRPIIIKRKLGYHVYRDSDEEMAYAEPGEKCREQVKFKLCDHEPVSSSKNGLQSPTFKCFNNHKTDNEMENSIKMAKEAVEHLQKDLKRMEFFSPKMNNPHIEDIESNTELHHDIEIAREALEHIEHNFESVNLEVNKVNELQVPKSQDEERLTRWREAIENIHKNFEIVKNIEDAFKSNNHFSLFRSDSRKTVESEKPEHLGHVYVQNKFTNDNLENNDEAYNGDKILKSASNEVGIAQLTPKTENVDNIGKDMGNDMFVSPAENREDKIRLHSDSLKSDINYKDTFLRSDVSGIESTKHESNVPKESVEYDQKKSLSEVPNYSEHEKTASDHISEDYKLLSKVSSNSDDSLDKNLQIEEQKTIDKSELMMKTALSDRDNRNLLIKMKSVKEILGNKKDQEKAATSNEKNINEYEELFKSRNENSPLERLSLMPTSDIEQTSTNIENSKNSEAGGDERIHSDKYNNKEIENQENKSKSYSSIMRLSNDQLEKTDELSAYKFVTTDQDVLQSPHLFSLKEKNVLDDEENDQNESHHKIKENHEFHDSLKGSEKEVKDKVQNFKSSEVKDGKVGLEIIQNQELTSFLNDDSVKKVDKKVPTLYKTVSEASNEPILNDRAFENQHSIEENKDLAQNKDANEDSKLQFSKSVSELYSDPILSMPTAKVDISNDQHSHISGVRLSQTQNEKLKLNEYHEGDEHTSTRFDIENSSEDTKSQFFKSVPELKLNPIASLPTDKVEISNDQQSHRAETSMRSSEIQEEKMHLNENQELHEPLPIGLDIKSHAEERTWQSSKSVPELTYDPMVSMLTEKVDITDDQYAHKEEASMRSSESQNEKMHSNENQELHEPVSIGLDIESHAEERTWQSSKSVPELTYDPMVSMPTEKVDITDDQHAHKEEASMRSSEIQEEKMHLNENQELHEPLPIGLDIKSHAEERTWQSSKSVPELTYDPMVSMSTEKVDITDDQHAHKEEASMRSSESQNEKMHSNENQELHEPLSIGLDIESHAEERTWQSSKSVPELTYDPMVSMPTEKVDITDDKDAHKEEANMRLAESPNEKNQNEKLLLNEYQEGANHVSTTLNNEHNSDDTKTQYLKSVPELQYYPIASLLTDKVDITNDQHFHKEDASMRSSESYNEKMQSNEYQESHVQLPTGLDSESYPKERTWQSSKSVSEVPNEPMVSMPTRKVDITDDQNTHKAEESMRSAESQSEKLLLNEYQKEADHASTTLNNEHNSDDTKQQYLKSVPELQSYPIVSLLTDKKDITNDQHFHKEDASMRSSESYNEKMQSNEYQELHEQLPMGLNSESHPKERTWQSSKSVPGLLYDSMVAMPTRKVDITDDQRAQKEEESMRSSGSQSEKLQLNEYQEETEQLPIGLDIERHPEERTWQSSKSVPELPYDSIISMPTRIVDITDDQRAQKGEESMRSSGSQSEKLLLNEYQEEPEQLPMGIDSESRPKERTWQSSKSVPELPYESMVSMPTRKVDFTDDQSAQKGEESMRSSGSQGEKLQLNENQEEPEQLPMGLDSENHPKDRTWQSSKSVPELPYDLMVSMPTRKVDIIDDQRSHKGEESVRSSERQSEKLQLNEYQEEPEQALTIFNIENNSDDSTSQLLKSVSEQQPYLIASLPRDNEGITNYQHLQGEEAIMRSVDSQNEKNLSNENQNLVKPLSMGLDIERHPEERTWQSSKSVPELPNDPRISMPTKKVDVTDDLHAHKEEMSMRSSESQSEKLQLDEYQYEPEHASSKLNFENSSDDIKSDVLKSVPEVESHPLALFLTDKVDNTNNQHLQGEEMSMRLAVGQNKEKIKNENQEVNEPLLMELDIERHPEEHTWQSSKSVPELPYDPMESMPTEKVDITYDQYVHKEEASMRSSEAQSEKLQFNEYHKEPEHASMKLDVEKNPDNIKSQFLKSVSELPFPTVEVGITNNRHLQGEKGSMRSAEGQNEENHDVHELWPMGLHIERHPEEHTWQYYKSVPELSYDSMVSMPTEKVVIPNDQYSYTGDDSMRASETQKEKLQLNDYNNGPVHSLTRFDVKYEVDNQKPHFLKSVSELHSDPKVSLPIDKVYINDDQYTHAEDSTQSQNEKLQLTDIQEAHQPFIMQLDMTNQPEDRKWQVSKSVLELPFDSMVSMPTDKVEITNEHKTLKEGNMRLSQNQNEGTQFQESLGLQDFFPTKLSTENHPEYSTSLFKSTSQLYKTRSNINHGNNENFYSLEDAKLSQNQNEGQQHLFESLSSRPDNEKKVEENSLTANKVRFSYLQNPMKEKTTMRSSQNQNENKEMQYLSSIKGLGNEHLNREENREHIMDDYMHLSAAQHQQFHENTNPMLRSSNDRQHLSHNFKSRPEHKMIPPTSDRQNVLNERMRINEQQSRDPEPVENQNLHNSFSMRWNTDDQHQNPSTKTFKYNSDFDHTLHGNNEFDNEQFIPHEVSNSANTLGYRPRPQLFGDHILDDTQSNRWYQTKQYNDHFANYYKTIPEVHDEYMNPHFHKHLHRVAGNRNLNDADTFSSHDSPSNRARLHEHMQKYHQEKSSNVDSSMEQSMHMSMREPFAKSSAEFDNMHPHGTAFNHPHGTARFGAGLPIAGVNSGAVGVFPTANAGGCGIPLLLSCSPSVVSGSLARSHIAGPVFKSADDNYKYYIKRDAKNIADVPDIKVQKTSFAHNYGTSEI